MLLCYVMEDLRWLVARASNQPREDVRKSRQIRVVWFGAGKANADGTRGAQNNKQGSAVSGGPD